MADDVLGPSEDGLTVDGTANTSTGPADDVLGPSEDGLTVDGTANTSTGPADDVLGPGEDEEFRARCRRFLDQHATGIDLGGRSDPRGELRLRAAQRFQGALAEAGLAGLTHPAAYGGAGLTKAHERAWREECSRYPNMTYDLLISHGMCLPMIAEYGSHAHKAAYLARIISGEDVWCQMFSEPGAGSDVASLQTRAERDGDVWIINGQKVWTTLAHLCAYGIVIARTDPAVPKHAGISMFIVPMDADGVEVRPIHQIDGGTHFNEVFFTDVHIGADNLLGEENNGWRMATAMLMYERVAIGSGTAGGITTDRTDRLIAEARKRGLDHDPAVRQKLMKLRILETCGSLVAMRTRAEMRAGRTPGPGGSIGKLATAQIAAVHTEVSMAIAGAAGVAWSDDADAYWQRQALTALQAGIAGGTSEIQRNIIGDRVLGLPRDVSVDRGVAFKDLAVGTQTT